MSFFIARASPGEPAGESPARPRARAPRAVTFDWVFFRGRGFRSAAPLAERRRGRSTVGRARFTGRTSRLSHGPRGVQHLYTPGGIPRRAGREIAAGPARFQRALSVWTARRATVAISSEGLTGFAMCI